DDPREDCGKHPGARDRGVALRPLCDARRDQLRREGRRRASQPVRRSRDQGDGEGGGLGGSEVALMAAVSEQAQQQENPLEEGLLLRRTPDPCALVIFGASGDLTHKKLMPALYALMVRRLLPPRYAIVGVARTEGDDDFFREDMKQAVQQHARDEFREEVWDELAENMHYVATDFADEGGENA